MRAGSNKCVVYFFVQAGVGSEHVFKFATGALGLASVGVIISWFLLYRIGRRTLYIWASGSLVILLLLIGIISAVSESQSASFAQAGLVCVWEILFYATIGPVSCTKRKLVSLGLTIYNRYATPSLVRCQRSAFAARAFAWLALLTVSVVLNPIRTV